MAGKNLSDREKLLQYTKENSMEKVLISAPTKNKESIINDFLKSVGIRVNKIKEWGEFLNNSKGIYITPKILSNGFATKDKNTAIIGETDLFGQRSKRHVGTRKRQNPEAIIENLKDLRIGTLVVHRDYGIGKYDGLTKLTIDEVESEYICINYAKGDLLQLPITQMEKILSLIHI